MKLDEYKRIRAEVIRPHYCQDIAHSKAAEDRRKYSCAKRVGWLKWTVARPIFDRIWRVIQGCAHFKKNTTIRLCSTQRQSEGDNVNGYRDNIATLQHGWGQAGISGNDSVRADHEVSLGEKLTFCAKPDRHLERIAAHYQKSVESLCTDLAQRHGDILRSNMERTTKEKMTEKFLSVSPVPASAADVIERQRRQLLFWRTWAAMMTIFFGLLFVYVISGN